MRKMKDSGVAWIGEIPEEWNLVELKWIIDDVKTGTTPKGADDKYYAEFGIPWFTPSDFTEFPYLHTSSKKLSALGEQEVKIFPPNSILLVGIASIGKVALFTNYCSSNQQINAIICSEKISPLYITYFLSTISDYLLKCGKFTIMPIINQEETKNIFVPYPSTQEQHRIADYLDTKCAEIDRSMELVRKGIDKLKEYKKSVITEAVTKGLDPDVPMKDSGVPWIGDIPEGWTLTKIAYGIDYTGSGTTPPSDRPQWYQGNIPWITTSELRESIIYSTNKYVSEEALATFSALKIYPRGSLLIAMYGATIGRMGFLGTEATTNQACCVLYGENKLILKYIFYFIYSQKEIILSLSQGSGQPNLNQEIIRSLRIPAPNPSEQNRISVYLDAKCAEIDALITQKQALLDKLAEYKKSLIFECVTGKREVAA